MWETFPRQLEQNINGLLDSAEPNSAKAFQLYKTCKNEDLWRDSFEEFAKRLGDFYARPRPQRRKSDFDAFLDRPMDRVVYEGFHLNFRTALVNGKSVHEIASWAHHLIRVGAKTTSAVISVDVLHRTLIRIVNPPLFEKAENIEFEDFCRAWSKTVFTLYGRRHDPELNSLLRELRWLHKQILESETATRDRELYPTIYLTQTEIDWTLAVRAAAETYAVVPKFPLSRGPQKQRLIDLERASLLYNLVQTTRLPELLRHRENIRATILAQCDGLIREKAA